MEDIFSGLADRYDRWFDEHAALYQSEIEAVRALMPNSRRAIEIGVGTGRFSAALGCPEGIDPSEDMAAIARRRGIRVYPGVAEKIPSPDGSYELAMMVTVDCFLSDVSAAFQEVNRILTPGGVFVLAFLNRETPLGRIYARNQANDDFYKHARFHSAAEIERFLSKAGLVVEDTRQTVFSFDPCFQPAKPGIGEGLFTVIRAVKEKYTGKGK